MMLMHAVTAKPRCRHGGLTGSPWVVEQMSLCTWVLREKMNKEGCEEMVPGFLAYLITLFMENE